MVTSLSIFILLGLSLVMVRADLCDFCKCTDLESDNGSDDENSTTILEIKCNGMRRNKKIEKISLENILWPTTNKRISASFNNMKLVVLPKLPFDMNVVSLNFDNNEIRTIATEPFQYFSQLETLSIANNKLTTLTPDFLRMKKKLRYLNLANNSLNEIDIEILQKMDELKALDLSHNDFHKVSLEFVSTLKNVETINFYDNKIFVLEQPTDTEIFWKNLNLSENQLTVLTLSTFKNFKLLENINVSGNKIINVDNFAFFELKNLTKLDLSANYIEEISLHLPESLEVLIADGNRLRTWPLSGTPNNLREIYLQNNVIVELYQAEDKFDNLQTLNISGNKVEILPSNILAVLKVLDVSYNHLTAVPQALKRRTPMLETLVLDNNDIENIVFHEKTSLSYLSMSNMPNLKVLQDNTFSNIEGIKVRQDGTGTCVDIKISHCPLLSKIDEKAFDGVNLCKLDLSYNQLTVIPQNLTNWRDIEEGIDLQGNAFICTCESQWMLDVILNSLYTTKAHQYLLKDLTCGSPYPFTSTRFVKYYRRPKAFCNPSSAMVMAAGFGGNDSEEPDYAYLRGPNFMTIIICSAMLLLTLIAAGVYLTIEQKRRLSRKNRRF